MALQAASFTPYIHFKETRHSFNNTDVVILDREEDWVRRGIMGGHMGKGGAAFSQPQSGAPFQFVQHMGPGAEALS